MGRRVGWRLAGKAEVVTLGAGDVMSKRLLWTPGYRLDDIEFEPVVKRKPKPIAKTAVKPAAPVKKPKANSRGKGALKRHRADLQRRKRALQRKLKAIARIVAADLLEMRAEENELAIAKWREQQAREAKAFAEKMAVAFHRIVKEAAEKTAA